MRARAATAILALIVLPAAAREPLIVPTRDVAVTYAIAAPGSGRSGATLTERMRWDAAGQRYRVDPPTPGTWTLVDRRKHTLTVLRDANHEAVVIPEATTPPPAPVAGAGGFVRGGTDTVAGVACTDWRTTDARGEAVRACITADGVLLRASVGGFTVMEAKTVAYGVQPPEVFAVPPNFRVVHPRPLDAPQAAVPHAAAR